MARTTRLGGGFEETQDLKAYRELVKAGHVRSLSYVRLLGLDIHDPIELVARVENGLGFHALERFQRNTMLSTKELAEVVLVKLRTLRRRKDQGRLAPDESDRLLRFSRVYAKALELFEGDSESARRWLFTPLKALNGAPPFSLAKTDVGIREVEDLIGRLEHGVPS